MAEETTATETTEAEPVTTTSTTTKTETEQTDQLGEAGKKALDAERRNARNAVKERDALAARLQELEDRDKTELQKATERALAAERERDQARVEGLRSRIAVKHGISEEDADLFLTAGDEESLTRQAERLTAREAQRVEAAEAELAERRRRGLRVPLEGGQPNHENRDTEALGILGFGT